MARELLAKSVTEPNSGNGVRYTTREMFDRMDERFDELSGRMNRVESRLSAMAVVIPLITSLIVAAIAFVLGQFLP